MIKKMTKFLKPIGYTIGAISILAISEYMPKDSLYNPIVMALVYMHTVPLICEDSENIIKDKFRLICYVYSLTIFLLTKSVVCLLMLNIFQSFNGLYKIRESEANVNRTNI